MNNVEINWKIPEFALNNEFVCKENCPSRHYLETLKFSVIHLVIENVYSYIILTLLTWSRQQNFEFTFRLRWSSRNIWLAVLTIFSTCKENQIDLAYKISLSVWLYRSLRLTIQVESQCIGYKYIYTGHSETIKKNLI